MPPRDDDSSADRLRRLLLDAALEILGEPETPLDLRKVAERAGKSRTAPYLAFGKESDGGGLLGLKIAVAAEGTRQMTERMASAARELPTPLEAFHAAALAFLDFAATEPRLFGLTYGPDITAPAGLGDDGIRSHPEFARLRAARERMKREIRRLIEWAQDRGELPADPGPPSDEGAGDVSTSQFLDRPGDRMVHIAWSSMLGVALLRTDDLVRAFDGPISPEQGARLVVESVFRLDTKDHVAAARSFVEFPDTRPPDSVAAEQEFRVAMDMLPASRIGSSIRVAETADAIYETPEPPATGDVEEPPPDRAARGLPLFEGRAMAPAARQLEFPLSETLARHSGLARAARSRTLLSRARILWIDDHPQWIEKGVETLEKLGARVRVATTTAAAKRELATAVEADGRGFDVILSDIARGSRPDAGIRALPELNRLAPDTPVIFFVGELDPDLGVPDGAVGITNRTNELLHLVMDALEGRQGLGGGRRPG